MTRGVGGAGYAPYIARTRGFLAHIKQSAHVVKVHVANVRPYNSFTASTRTCCSTTVSQALPLAHCKSHSRTKYWLKVEQVRLEVAMLEDA